MSDQALELVIKARDESSAAFKSLDKSMEGWTASQQRAAQKMEALHEKALKLNSSFKPLTDTTEQNAATLKAFGAALPIEQTDAMTQAVGLASVGFKTLNTSTAGFNAQSAGVVGAGLAIGTAIGAWLNTFPAVRAAVDSVTEGLYSLITGMEIADEKAKAMAGIGKFQKDMAASNEEAVKRQIAGQLKHGATIEQLAKNYSHVAREARTAEEIVKAMAESHKKAAAAAKDWLSEVDKATAAFEKARVESDKFDENMRAKGAEALKGMGEDQKRFFAEQKQLAEARGKAQVQALEDEAKAREQFFKDAMEDIKAQDEAQAAAHERMLGDLQDIANVFHQIGGKGFGALGDILGGVVSIGHSIDQWKTAGQGFGGLLTKLSAGLGIAGTVFGVGKSIIGSLFGGDKEHKQVNDMRDEFVKAAGGIAALDAKAHAAGKTLTEMLNAKTVGDYETAIQHLNGAMDLHGQAMSALEDAQKRYGIGWSELDQIAGGLLKDQNLLIAAGFSQQEVANGMADAYSKYVQTVIEGGGTIPEAMRPTIELLAEQGKLVDENGDAYDEATVKGLSFTDKLTDQMSKLVDEIHRMVNALLGINDIDLDVGVRSHPVQGGGGEDFRSPEGMAGGGMSTTWGMPAILHGTRSNPEHAVREDRLRDIVRQETRGGGGNAGVGGDIYVTVQGSTMDGQVVARSVTRRVDLNKARSKGALRGRAR